MELIDRLERELTQRLSELRPLVEEARKLEETLARLTGREVGTAPKARGRSGNGRRRGSASRASSSATPTKRRTRARSTRQPRRRMSGEQRREQVLSIIRQNPNVKAREIAEQTGTTPNNIYNIIRRLEAEGKLRRADGRFAVPG